MKRVFCFIVLIFSVLYVNAQQTVTTVGESTIMVVPDQVYITVRISNEDADPKQAKLKNDSVVSGISHYLKNSGIPSKNYQTTYVQLSKQNKARYDEKPKMVYIASQSITICLEDLKKYDSLMEDLINLNVNEIERISFSSSRKEEYLKEARRKAALNAKQKAETYADALSQNVGGAMRIVEESSTMRNTYSAPMAFRASKISADEQDSTLMEGVIKVEARVSVEFHLN